MCFCIFGCWVNAKERKRKRKSWIFNFKVTVKLWFTTMILLALIPCQIWLYFVQSFSCIFLRFNVRVGCESLVKICEESEVRNWLAIDSWVNNPQKVTWEAYARIWTVFARLYFASHFSTQAKSRVTHETHYLNLFEMCFSHFFLPTLYKSTLSTKL